MGQHTPGPWHIEYELNVVAGGRSVASCGGYSTNADDGQHMIENRANACLIAAAPDLLEALRPFAAMGERCHAEWPDDYVVFQLEAFGEPVRIGDLRRAAAAIAAAEEG